MDIHNPSLVKTLAIIRRVRLLIVVAVLTSVLAFACGTDKDGVAAGPDTNPSVAPNQTTAAVPEIIFDREEATEIALKRIEEGWDSLVHSPGPATDIRDITVRFMSLWDLEQLQGLVGSGWSRGPDWYGPDDYAWVVQVRAESTLPARNADDEEMNFRYAIEAVNVKTGRFAASGRTVSEPYFISAEINDPSMPDPSLYADPATPTKISREQARKLALEQPSRRRDPLPDRAEIELIKFGEDDLLWWIYVPADLQTVVISQPPSNDERYLRVWSGAAWYMIDANTGEVLNSESVAKIGPRVANEEGTALRRFAYAEGWWELWHQLKPFNGENLPEGFAASLDRPNAPTPTPRPPTPTPDPNATPRPTSTPAPTETLDPNAPLIPTATAAPTPNPVETESLRRNPNWPPESPSTSIDKTFHIGMAIRTSEDMQLRFDAWPDEHKMLVSPSLVVVFAYDLPAISWVAPVFINHIPSFSTIYLDENGEVDDKQKINSDEADQAFADLLADEDLMAEIIARARQFWR